MNIENKIIKKINIIEPNELIKKIKKRFTKKDLIVLLTVLILGLINNFNYFINEGCSPDVLNKGNIYIWYMGITIRKIWNSFYRFIKIWIS